MDKLYLIPPVLWLLAELYVYSMRKNTIAEVQGYLATLKVTEDDKEILSYMLDKSLSPWFMVKLIVLVPIFMVRDACLFFAKQPNSQSIPSDVLRDKKIRFYSRKLMQQTSITLFTILIIEILLIMAVFLLVLLVILPLFVASYEKVNEFKKNINTIFDNAVTSQMIKS